MVWVGTGPRSKRSANAAALDEGTGGGHGGAQVAPSERRARAPDPERRLPSEIDWRICRFGELSPVELARIYRARQLVFTIEQQCIYLDADEYDELSCHFAAWSPEHALPLAYARLLNPGAKYAEPSMGRVITTEPARGLGLGRELVRRVVAHCAQVHPRMAIRISAQERLERFYADFGFTTVGDAYLEDGIPHLEMLRPP
jgi:ElaA protein